MPLNRNLSSTCSDESLKKAHCGWPPRLDSTGAVVSPRRSLTAAPHCSTDSRHSRRGIAHSGVQATVLVPPAPPLPMLPPVPVPPPTPPVPVALMQTPAVHVDPAGQGLHPPQCMTSPTPGPAQAPSGHCVSPVGHIPMQLPLLQTSVPAQTIVQEPQCCAFEAT